MIMPTIALLSDFGLHDAYVGVMKGVMSKICSDAQFVDLTHAVQPQNVRQGAFILLTSYSYFPKGTVFLTVVDPGVGSERRALAVRAGDYTFVAPDNGLLSYVLRRYPYSLAVELTSTAHRLTDASSTFHGRDVFAPAAAYLACGEALDRLGKRVSERVSLPQPMLQLRDGWIEGEVLHIDHYGNIITSIGVLKWTGDAEITCVPAFGSARTPSRIAAETARCRVGEADIPGVARHYAQVEPGNLLALVGSSGFLEISVNRGSAAARLNVQLGEPVSLYMG